MTSTYRPNLHAGFVIDLDALSFIEQPQGNTKTVQEVLDFERINQPAPLPQTPDKPIILSAPVTIPNDALPQNLDELQVFLTANAKYTFRFRATRYSSDVTLDLSFAVPGDADAATISWNDTTFNGLTLGDDDESPMAATGNDISSSEVSGTITVNSEAGFFTPQVRQDTADNQDSEVTEAYMEVTQSG